MMMITVPPPSICFISCAPSCRCRTTAAGFSPPPRHWATAGAIQMPSGCITLNHRRVTLWRGSSLPCHQEACTTSLGSARQAPSPLSGTWGESRSSGCPLSQAQSLPWMLELPQILSLNSKQRAKPVVLCSPHQACSATLSFGLSPEGKVQGSFYYTPLSPDKNFGLELCKRGLWSRPEPLGSRTYPGRHVLEEIFGHFFSLLAHVFLDRTPQISLTY
uniref:Uncharacterized protein LOC110218565 n=1 Tax=Phascolarctos cinereus TaxID=38626 RepID=A0A6P5LF45_PHACI|nr:uncharacterized protein LOC110218565 [Phascolarctos cinereus]